MNQSLKARFLNKLDKNVTSKWHEAKQKCSFMHYVNMSLSHLQVTSCLLSTSKTSVGDNTGLENNKVTNNKTNEETQTYTFI